MTLTVTPVNDPPACSGISVSTPRDTSAPLVLACTDVDGDALSYQVVTPPAHGKLSGSGASLTYEPDSGYEGSDGFIYKANDGALDSNAATASIIVTHKNHVPTCTKPNPNKFVVEAGQKISGQLCVGADPDPGDGSTLHYVVAKTSFAQTEWTVNYNTGHFTYTAGASTAEDLPKTFTVETVDRWGGHSTAYTGKITVIGLQITKISPVTGPALGGTVVTIKGTSFARARYVYFINAVSHGVTQADATVVSPTEIKTTIPTNDKREPGIDDVVVETVGNESGEDGTSGIHPEHEKFTFTPEITGLTPASGPSRGGTVIGISGGGFGIGQKTTFSFGETKATSVECQTTIHCTVTAPPHAAGVADITANYNGIANPPKNVKASKFKYTR